MYYEPGHFNGDDLVVSEAIDWLKTNFNAWRGRGLVPLGTLLRMSRSTFYGRDASQVYSQAGMLIFYLFAATSSRNIRSTMSELIDGLNSGRFVDENDDRGELSFSKLRHLTIEQLEQEYVATGGFLTNPLRKDRPGSTFEGPDRRDDQVLVGVSRDAGRLIDHAIRFREVVVVLDEWVQELRLLSRQVVLLAGVGRQVV